MIRIAKINLDIRKDAVVNNEPIILRQGESDVTIEATVLNGGDETLQINFATFVAKKPDGTIVSNDPANVNGSVIDYPVSDHLTESVGNIQDAYFMINNQITTCGFDISIIPSTQLDDTSVSYIPGIENINKFLADTETDWLGRIQQMKSQITGLSIPDEFKLLMDKTLSDAKAQYQPIIDAAEQNVESIAADLAAKKLDLQNNSDELNKALTNIKAQVASITSFLDRIQKQIIDANTSFTADQQTKVSQSIADSQKKLADSIASMQSEVSQSISDLKAQVSQSISNLKAKIDALGDQFTLNQVNPWMIAVSPDIEAQLSSYEATINKDDGVVRILNLQDTHTSEAAIGDASYQLAAPKSIDQIQSLSMIADDVDLVVANGDNINGNETKAMNIHRNQQFVDTVHGVFDSKPALITLGNHDDGSVFDADTDCLTLSELTDIMSYSKYAQGENRPGGTATYSYYDFNGAKLRVISLDGFENPEVYNADGTIKYKRASTSVFTEAQLEWLVQALTLDADWHVIIFNHSPFKGFYGNAPYSTMNDVNHDVLNQILQAFANATTLTTTGNNNDFPVSITADFSKQAKGMLIACVFGHEHRDAAKQVINGVPAIERTCDIAVGDGRTVDTVSAYGIDVIEVDAVNKTINFNRFGAGSSVKWTF